MGQGGITFTENPIWPDESQDEYLLRLVRTVRNNLFHGGKYPYPECVVEDAARNRGLLEDSLAILDQCLAMNERLDGHFAEAA